MGNWIPKNKTVKFVAIAALLSALLYFGGLFVVFREIKKVENLYNDTESEFSKEKKFLAIKTIDKTNKEVIQTLRSFFIQKGDEVKFIEQIEGVARASAIKFDIAAINVKANQKDSFKEDVDIKMNIEGSWKNISYFVNKLEKMSFGVLIGNINLDANASGDWSGFVEFIIFREK